MPKPVDTKIDLGYDVLDFIIPKPSQAGKERFFNGRVIDTEISVVNYRWNLRIDNKRGTTALFTTAPCFYDFKSLSLERLNTGHSLV